MTQPRDDYLELLELALIFLGESPYKGIRFKAPGAMHHARWLAKALYALKMFMFRGQFRLLARELKGLRDVCIFVIRFYIKAWFTAPLAIQAARHDLTLLQELIQYSAFHETICRAALSKLVNHFSYLSEDIILLSLFDDGVPVETKVEIISAINTQTSFHEIRHKTKLIESNCEKLMTKNLSDFCSRKSLVLLERFGISDDFLNLPLDQWIFNESYQNGLLIFK